MIPLSPDLKVIMLNRVIAHLKMFESAIISIPIRKLITLTNSENHSKESQVNSVVHN